MFWKSFITITVVLLVILNLTLVEASTPDRYFDPLDESVKIDENKFPFTLSKFTNISKKNINVMLTAEQYYVTQGNGTDFEYKGFTNFTAKGIYKCIICDSKVFDSKDKLEFDPNYHIYPGFAKTIGKLRFTEGDGTPVNMTCLADIRWSDWDAFMGEVVPHKGDMNNLVYSVMSSSLFFEPAEGVVKKDHYIEDYWFHNQNYVPNIFMKNKINIDLEINLIFNDEGDVERSVEDNGFRKKKVEPKE